MASVAERRLKARRACDRAFAERVRVIPMKSGGAVIGAPDPAIPAYDTVGIFRMAAAVQEVHGRGSGRGERMQAQGARTGLSFALGAVGTPDKPTPAKGWHVVMLEQPGEPEFRFVPSAYGAAGRISFDLVPLGADDE